MIKIKLVIMRRLKCGCKTWAANASKALFENSLQIATVGQRQVALVVVVVVAVVVVAVVVRARRIFDRMLFVIALCKCPSRASTSANEASLVGRAAN